LNASAAPLVRWFEHLALGDRPSVGGKGASLGELTQAGIPTPRGFVVTTAAFLTMLDEVDATGALRAAVAQQHPDDLEELASASAALRTRIEAATLPAALAAQIAAAYTELSGGDTTLPVAVRSSATSEDSAEASFAGLQDTHLWVRGGDAIDAALRACWGSLYSVESVSYRRRLGLAEDNVAMAVVIQKMVRSRASGVMFTRSPTTGDRSVIAIEGSWGLGSCIVSGEVTPDRFTVNKVTGEIRERTLSEKLLRHVPEESGGIRSEAVPADQQKVACISDVELRTLVDVARNIERHYGSPQDIEWAIADEEGSGARVYLLQSRPETVWAQRAQTPVATPRASAFDHVLAVLGGRKAGP